MLSIVFHINLPIICINNKSAFLRYLIIPQLIIIQLLKTWPFSKFLLESKLWGHPLHSRPRSRNWALVIHVFSDFKSSVCICSHVSQTFICFTHTCINIYYTWTRPIINRKSKLKVQFFTNCQCLPIFRCFNRINFWQ